MTSIPASGSMMAVNEPRLPPPFNPRKRFVRDASDPKVQAAALTFARDFATRANAVNDGSPRAKERAQQAQALINTIRNDPYSVSLAVREDGKVTSAISFAKKGPEVQLTASVTTDANEELGLLQDIWDETKPSKMTWRGSAVADPASSGASVTRDPDGVSRFVWTERPSARR